MESAALLPGANDIERRTDLSVERRLVQRLEEPGHQRPGSHGDADGVTHTLKVQALGHGLANVMFEIRSDLVADAAGQRAFAERLSRTLTAAWDLLQQWFGPGADVAPGRIAGGQIHHDIGNVKHDIDKAKRLIKFNAVKQIKLILPKTDIAQMQIAMTFPNAIALLASCDAYVSLHRAEGFGMGLAEAMALGKPVIATGYSGNMDFMTVNNSYPVRYDLRTITEDDHALQPVCTQLYAPGGTWAEPDLDHAAAQMRRVVENPAEAAQVSRRARADIHALYSRAAVGALIRERLDTLGRGS